MSSRVSVGGLPEPGRGRGGGWNRTASRRERGRRGAKPERLSLDSSSHAGQFAASGGARWRISNI